jgi:hypothetical protein
MITDPFADLKLDPSVKQAADAVRARMSTWIDGQVDSLKTEMTAKAASAASDTVAKVQSQLTDALNNTDNQLQLIQRNLAAISVNFVDPGLKAQADSLQAAITAHQNAVAQQKAQIQQAGQMVGTVIQKALLAAL